jgi:hypothetical protein
VIEPLRIYGVVEDLAHWGGRLFRYMLKSGLVQPLMSPSSLRFPSGILEGLWEEDRLSRTPFGGHEGMKIEGFNASQCEGD